MRLLRAQQLADLQQQTVEAHVGGPVATAFEIMVDVGRFDHVEAQPPQRAVVGPASLLVECGHGHADDAPGARADRYDVPAVGLADNVLVRFAVADRGDGSGLLSFHDPAAARAQRVAQGDHPRSGAQPAVGGPHPVAERRSPRADHGDVAVRVPEGEPVALEGFVDEAVGRPLQWPVERPEHAIAVVQPPQQDQQPLVRAVQVLELVLRCREMQIVDADRLPVDAGEGLLAHRGGRVELGDGLHREVGPDLEQVFAVADQQEAHAVWLVVGRVRHGGRVVVAGDVPAVLPAVLHEHDHAREGQHAAPQRTFDGERFHEVVEVLVVGAVPIRGLPDVDHELLVHEQHLPLDDEPLRWVRAWALGQPLQLDAGADVEAERFHAAAQFGRVAHDALGGRQRRAGALLEEGHHFGGHPADGGHVLGDPLGIRLGQRQGVLRGRLQPFDLADVGDHCAHARTRGEDGLPTDHRDGGLCGRTRHHQALRFGDAAPERLHLGVAYGLRLGLPDQFEVLQEFVDEIGARLHGFARMSGQRDRVDPAVDHAERAHEQEQVGRAGRADRYVHEILLRPDPVLVEPAVGAVVGMIGRQMDAAPALLWLQQFGDRVLGAPVLARAQVLVGIDARETAVRCMRRRHGRRDPDDVLHRFSSLIASFESGRPSGRPFDQRPMPSAARDAIVVRAAMPTVGLGASSLSPMSAGSTPSCAA